MHGRFEYEWWLDKLSPEVARTFRFNLSASGWYPLHEYLVEPTEAYCYMFHNGDMKGAWEQGKFNADYSLNGMYKIFMKLGSVEFIMNRAVKILPAFYKPSALEVLEAGGNSCVVRITEFPEINKLIEYRLAGWLDGALKIHGCRNGRVEISESIADGGHSTDFHLTWE